MAVAQKPAHKSVIESITCTKIWGPKKLEVFLIKLCRCNLKAYRTSISCLYDRLRTEKFSFCRSKCNYNSLYCLFVKVIVFS